LDDLQLYHESVNDYDRAAELDHVNSDTFNKRALVRIKLGQPDLARLDFDHALELNPKKHEWTKKDARAGVLLLLFVWDKKKNQKKGRPPFVVILDHLGLVNRRRHKKQTLIV